MKTYNQKFSDKQGTEEIITAVFVISALVLFFAVVVYNMITHGVFL